jgi:hypothetical protein
MFANELEEIMPIMLQARRNFMLVSGPGAGKTDLMGQAVEKLDWDMSTVIAVTAERTEISGFPWVYVTDGKVQAKKVPIGQLEVLFTASRPTVVFFDDLGQSPDSVQGGLMQLWWSRKIGDKPISEYIRFAAATNKREHRAGVTRIISPFLSRLTILNLEVSAGAWDIWARKHNRPPILRAFIKSDPGMLYQFKATNDIENSPSPRTVAEVGKILTEGYPESVLGEVIEGVTGSEWATTFMGFYEAVKSNELPPMREVFQDPHNARIPQRVDLQYYVCLALANNTTKETLPAVIEYTERMGSSYEVFTVLEAKEMNKSITETSAYSSWIVHHPEFN